MISYLVNPTKKLILSNVCPKIPNTIIESGLNNIGFILLTLIIKLITSLNVEGFFSYIKF